MVIDRRRLCTKDSPAPLVRFNYSILHGTADLKNYEHPSATARCLDDDHDDWRYDCPACGGYWITEGPDA